MIKILSSHWTLPPFPETFMCLFLVGVFILQYLLCFVNCFLKIYLFLFYCLSEPGCRQPGSDLSCLLRLLHTASKHCKLPRQNQEGILLSPITQVSGYKSGSSDNRPTEPVPEVRHTSAHFPGRLCRLLQSGILHPLSVLSP